MGALIRLFLTIFLLTAFKAHAETTTPGATVDPQLPMCQLLAGYYDAANKEIGGFWIGGMNTDRVSEADCLVKCKGWFDSIVSDRSNYLKYLKGKILTDAPPSKLRARCQSDYENFGEEFEAKF